MAVEFNNDNFQTTVLESNVPVMVDFFTESCGPCRQLAPVIEELANDNDGAARVGKVNVGENMELAMRYGVSGVPTILVFSQGEVVARKVGALPKDQLQSLLDEQGV